MTATATATPCVTDGCLLVNDKVVTTGVPPNVVVSSAGAAGSAFVGATSSVPSSRHVFSLGVLQNLRFLSLYRFKIWWMIPRVGNSGSEIRMETQFLLVETKDTSAFAGENTSEPTSKGTSYVLFLPVLEGAFRASLQGTPSNELQFCIESGDASIQTTRASEAVFINSGENPFELIRSSIKTLASLKGTFSHIDHKKVPSHLDWFGWCTWDAFYKDVNLEGIIEGIQSFLDGGCPPKCLIIDDGWQETVNEFSSDDEPFIEGTTVKESEFSTRLIDFKENIKFRSGATDDSCPDLHHFVAYIKKEYGIRSVYMWHALVGYWGGLLPSYKTIKKYNVKITYPKQSPGNVGNLRDVAMDALEKYGVGLIDPDKVFNFYNALHSYLASCDVDGVKVDVQNVLETLGSGFGGRVSLTQKYQNALEQSILKNFKNNSVICCMSHNSDSIFSLKSCAVARASEDFMPREPTLQTLHVTSVAFNSLFLGEIVVPDWDMFHSKHETAEFHAAARAIGGCAVYVSDKPGMHDFKILRKLVLPDGSVLRARYAGRPTRDCLFTDPIMDGKSLLKIWNLNKLTGVIGAFNCQGAGTWPLQPTHQQIPNSDSGSANLTILGHVSPQDIEYLGEIARDNWNGDCAVYSFHSGEILRLPKEGLIDVSLKTLQCEVYNVSPIRVFNEKIHFAPFGLIDMYNSGGAIEAINSFFEGEWCKVTFKVRGCGRFGAYSNAKPSQCLVDTDEVAFIFEPEVRMMIITLDGECKYRDIEIVYQA